MITFWLSVRCANHMSTTAAHDHSRRPGSAIVRPTSVHQIHVTAAGDGVGTMIGAYTRARAHACAFSRRYEGCAHWLQQVVATSWQVSARRTCKCQPTVNRAVEQSSVRRRTAPPASSCCGAGLRARRNPRHSTAHHHGEQYRTVLFSFAVNGARNVLCRPRCASRRVCHMRRFDRRSDLMLKSGIRH